MISDPDGFRPDPKPYRERLPRNSVSWKNRVTELFVRDGYRCFNCGNIFPRKFLAPCHKKSVGAGGGDDLKNLKTGCSFCHHEEHKANL